jgi:hypothetical protein
MFCGAGPGGRGAAVRQWKGADGGDLALAKAGVGEATAVAGGGGRL